MQQNDFFLKKWAIPGLFFLYFRLFNTVDNVFMNKFLPMTGFELRTSAVRSDRSTALLSHNRCPKNEL